MQVCKLTKALSTILLVVSNFGNGLLRKQMAEYAY